jgi:hypothetical protein
MRDLPGAPDPMELEAVAEPVRDVGPRQLSAELVGGDVSDH